MNVRCRNCGSENKAGSIICVVCYQSLVRWLRLEGDHGSMVISVTTDIGETNLRSVIGEDARFATSHQFRLERCPNGNWWIRNGANAKNAQFVNASPIPAEGHRLAEGDRLSLAGKRGFCTVRLVVET
jgi:hypothetical protein